MSLSLEPDVERIRQEYRARATLIIHEENGFCGTVENLLNKLWSCREELAPLGISEADLRFLSLRLQSKKHLNSELTDPHASLDRVPNEALYGSLIKPSSTNIISDISFIVEFLTNTIRSRHLDIAPPIFSGEICKDSQIQLNPLVLESIIRNAVKNSLRIAIERGKPTVHIKLSVSLVTESDSGRRYIQLLIDDDAGGLDDERIPKIITTSAWRSYLAARGGVAAEDHGNGFWLIARYAESSGGFFQVSNISEFGGKGVRCYIRIGLATE